jgi:hypothetical protein
MTAVIALVTMAAQSGGTTTGDGVQDLELWPGQRLPVTLPERASRHSNDVCHLKGWPIHDGSVSDVGVGL